MQAWSACILTKFSYIQCWKIMQYYLIFGAKYKGRISNVFFYICIKHNFMRIQEEHKKQIYRVKTLGLLMTAVNQYSWAFNFLFYVDAIYFPRTYIRFRVFFVLYSK